MKVALRVLTGTFAALAVTLTGPALSAHGAGYHFQSLFYVSGGSVQACRVPAASTKPFTIKVRVDARRATSRVSGVAWASHNDIQVGKKWSSGWVNKGTVSTVGTVYVPRGTAYRLSAGIGTGGMGNGGNVKPANLQYC